MQCGISNFKGDLALVCEPDTPKEESLFELFVEIKGPSKILFSKDTGPGWVQFVIRKEI